MHIGDSCERATLNLVSKRHSAGLDRLPRPPIPHDQISEPADTAVRCLPSDQRSAVGVGLARIATQRSTCCCFWPSCSDGGLDGIPYEGLRRLLFHVLGGRLKS